jgi:hypothetical protein
MAAVASRTGPLGIAIRGLFENIGRLTTYAATFAAFLAGRWVAGMAAAALSVRGLAAALVVLRGALIRTGIGALIVGAGELVYQFSRLVTGAGGFGNALELMGDVARAVWDGFKTTMSSFIDDFRALRADIESIWTRLMAFLSGKWAEFFGMIGPTFNAVADRIGADFQIDWFGVQSYAKGLSNPHSRDDQRDKKQDMTTSIPNAEVSPIALPPKAPKAVPATQNAQRTKPPPNSTPASFSPT